jgi:hypothetical protein
LASVAVNMYSHLVYFIRKLYKSCTFNAICIDNVSVNGITVQHIQNKSLSSTFNGPYARLVLMMWEVQTLEDVSNKSELCSGITLE